MNSSLNHQREGTSPIRSPLDFTLVSRICTSGPTSQDSTRQLLCLRRHRSLCLGKMRGQNSHCGNLERQAEVPQRSSKSSQVCESSIGNSGHVGFGCFQNIGEPNRHTCHPSCPEPHPLSAKSDSSCELRNGVIRLSRKSLGKNAIDLT